MADDKGEQDSLAGIEDVQIEPLSEEEIESVAGGTGAGSCTCCCPSGPTFTCPPVEVETDSYNQ